MDANIRRLVNDTTALLVRQPAAVIAPKPVAGHRRDEAADVGGSVSSPRKGRQHNPSHLGNNVDELV